MDVDSPPRRSGRKRSIPHTAPTNASRPPKKPKTQPSPQETQQDDTPSSYLRIYCMGNNDNGELGLGAHHGVEDVRVPTLNPYLSYPSPPRPKSPATTTATIKAKVIQLAVGGMHCAALTSANEILTWGVNDNGALGRDTSSARLEELIKNLTLQDDQDRDDLDLNILEARPGPVIFFDNNSPTPKDKIPRWKQIVACDSATFVLSTTGLVYGWGCTRSSQGISLWSSTPRVEIQRVPVLIPLDDKITKLSARGNHILALTEAGQVYTWGAGSEQGQLGRRLPKRRTQHLECAVAPRKTKLKDIFDIATGPDHSFAIDSTGKVFGWGLDNYAQTGVTNPSRSEEGSGLFIETPTRLTNLEKILEKKGKKIRYLTGGNSHSLCLLDDGSVWSWGRVDNCATGLDLEKLTKNEEWEREMIVKDGRGRARIVLCPVRILPKDGEGGDDVRIKWVEAGAEHGVAVTEEGRVVTWGFNASHQTGHKGEEIKVPRMVALKGDLEGVEFSWAGAGGHFTILGEEVRS
ncbi:regulator of chromosome condensation 1/beta-lactamase-inhibitor protein II [Triangularia verruculosa]|uniref:Regulator of chromosome condensation 1/beta-lactamase-inhibitor protein II n=1 Tax=Triangularia verruculosa TaxID=2587418 RepID=A0AAN6XNW7_9PEZI|nr:regulator of chromosome condensation 1/beta-lactamase-inhibitor protein II [Triangularia verruculosa]